MIDSTIKHSKFPKRLTFGILALLISATIATLIYIDLVTPHPNLKFSYLICVAVGVTGLIQLIIGLTELNEP